MFSVMMWKLIKFVGLVAIIYRVRGPYGKSYGPRLIPPGSRFVKVTINGADLGGGCRGCAPPPPEMTCGFLIQLVFCKKKNKNSVVYWC